MPDWVMKSAHAIIANPFRNIEAFTAPIFRKRRNGRAVPFLSVRKIRSPSSLKSEIEQSIPLRFEKQAGRHSDRVAIDTCGKR